MALSIALCGCGGMGRRHIRGMQKLQAVGRMHFELAAVCDLFPESAEQAADLAADLLGRRPTVQTTLTDLQGVDAVILATSPESHAVLGTAALEMGLHVMVEKPIDLTVARGQRLVHAARRTKRKLAVAENYRRDPINRLAKALIDAGAIGRPYLAIQSSSGGGERVTITPWRHIRARGGIVVDMGIHYADLLEYYLGHVDQLFGMNDQIDKERIDAAGQRHLGDAEDLSLGVARYQSGAVAHYLLDHAGRGRGHFTRVIHGTGGSLSIPRDRSGRPLELVQRKGAADIALTDADLLAFVPDFATDDVTATLFGGERLASYKMDFAHVDANLLAIEQADFVDAILNDREPEVNGEMGLRSLALVLGFLESELLARPVTMDEMLRGASMPHQAMIEEELSR